MKTLRHCDNPECENYHLSVHTERKRCTGCGKRLVEIPPAVPAAQEPATTATPKDDIDAALLDLEEIASKHAGKHISFSQEEVLCFLDLQRLYQAKYAEEQIL